ncbi:MAG: cytochrome b/b6 domain-containing protein [Thiohalocapsa sp.]|jgi:cytochrome b561
MATTRYTLTQRLLHWLIALLVLGLLAVGLTFWALGYDGTVQLFGNDMTNDLYKYHKTFGILVLVLMILRLVLRRASPPPPHDPPLGRLERIVGGGTHLLLYLLLLGMPIGGWLATAAGGFPVQFFDWELPGLIGKNEELSKTLFLMHGYAGLAVIALLVLHIGAGLRHWRRKDGVMRRISLP